jgi:hypothetical protein
MAWATIQEVEDITGVEVTPTELATASGIIELFSNRPVALADRMSARQRRLLRTATAWVSKQIHDDPTVFDNAGEVVSGSQDGVSFTYAAGSVPGVPLHPFAIRALMSLTHYGTTIVPLQFGGRTRVNFENEASDEAGGPWTPWRGGL